MGVVCSCFVRSPEEIRAGEEPEDFLTPVKMEGAKPELFERKEKKVEAIDSARTDSSNANNPLNNSS
jgi:hypothetical protein